MDLRNIKIWTTIAIIVFIFVISSYLSSNYTDQIQHYLGEQSLFKAIFIYLVISIASVVIAPISSLPLLPILANLWGGLWAGLISVIGWTIGNQIAFLLSRKYGHSLVRKIGSEKEITELKKYLPSEEENVFRWLVVLRIVFPVDLLSYVLGSFLPHIKSRTFFFSTLIGVAPGALLFSYLGTISIMFQLILFAVAFLIFYFGAKQIKNYRMASHRH